MPKKHEIGILRAVGARGSDVFGIFFQRKSMIIALINWVISTLFVFLSVAGINYFFRTEFNLAITVLVFGVLQMLLILAVSALTAFIASVIPVTKISRKKSRSTPSASADGRKKQTGRFRPVCFFFRLFCAAHIQIDAVSAVRRVMHDAGADIVDVRNGFVRPGRASR